MIKRVLIWVFLIITSGSYAQQQGLYSQYIFNLYVVNPAYAGELDAFSIAASYRTQWIGFEGAPKNQNLSLHTPLPNKKMALGLMLQNEEIGARQTPSASVTYAYKIKFNKKRRLSFGLSAGVINYQYRWDMLEYRQRIDPVAYQTDGNRWVPNFDFGVMYLTSSTYLGLSALSMNNSNTIESSFSDARLETSFNLIAGKVFQLSDNYLLKPSTIVRSSVKGPVQFDINLGLMVHNVFWINTTYRYEFGAVFSGHFYISPQFHVGYAYDLPTNSLLSAQSGTHEIFIGYEFSLYKAKSLSPRFF